MKIIILTEAQLIKAIRYMEALENKQAEMEPQAFDVFGNCLN